MPNTTYPLNKNVKIAFNNAKRIAEQNQRSSIDSLVLLLALLQLPNSQVVAILKFISVKVENLTARVSATIKIEAQEAVGNLEEKGKRVNLATENESILHESLTEMKKHDHNFIDEYSLLLGILHNPESKAGQILAQYNVTIEQVRESIQTIKKTHTTKYPIFTLPKTLRRAMSNGISPIFISLVLFTMAMLGFLWFDVGNNLKVFMFAFIIGGWLISLCLHEFGHAITAFWCGDESVEHKGYLTLNPLKYTHPIISVVIPLILLLMGGVAFPGGAVYININALRKPHYRSLVSGAGPLANLVCFAILTLPFSKLPFYYIFKSAPEEFLSAVGFLALLQMVALFINLLPIPGLDGFGILEPYLPQEWLGFASFLRPFGFFIIFFLLSADSPISEFFWENVWSVMELTGFNLAYFANEGVKMLFP